MVKRHVIALTPEQRKNLLTMIRSGKHNARSIQRAHILLLANDGMKDREISAVLYCGVATVERTRRRFATDDFDDMLADKPHPGKPSKLGPEGLDALLTLASSAPPALHKRWTLRLLAQELVARELIPSIDPSTIGRILKRNGHKLKR